MKISQKVNDFFEYIWYNLKDIMGICVKKLNFGLIP